MNKLMVSFVALAMVASACGSDDGGSGSSAATDTAGADGGAQDAGADAGGGGMEMQVVDPAPETKAILDKIKDFKKWDKFAENAVPKQSDSHMKMWVVTYHNDVVKTAIANKTLPLPDGAIIVKENMAKETDTMGMPTVMAKQNGKWYWIEATPDGKVVVDTMMDKGKPLEGNDPKMCTGCHSPQKDKNDWIFVHDFSK